MNTIKVGDKIPTLSGDTVRITSTKGSNSIYPIEGVLVNDYKMFSDEKHQWTRNGKFSKYCEDKNKPYYLDLKV